MGNFLSNAEIDAISARYRKPNLTDPEYARQLDAVRARVCCREQACRRCCMRHAHASLKDPARACRQEMWCAHGAIDLLVSDSRLVLSHILCTATRPHARGAAAAPRSCHAQQATHPSQPPHAWTALCRCTGRARSTQPTAPPTTPTACASGRSPVVRTGPGRNECWLFSRAGVARDAFASNAWEWNAGGSSALTSPHRCADACTFDYFCF